MTIKKLKEIINDLDDSAVLCVPDMYIENDGEVNFVEVDYVTTPCAPYINLRGIKQPNEDLLVIW
jgi:hypothetical protein